MFRLENFDLSDVNASPEPLQRLFNIFKTTLNPDLTSDEFTQYLFANHPDALEISFIYNGEDLAGFCTSAAYPRRCNGKKIIILRSAFGLYDDYKKGRFPLHGLFYKYIRYKLKHLFTPVYVAGFMANPLMYAMICRYTLRSYPRNNEAVPQEISLLKKTVLDFMCPGQEEEKPFVMRIHFQVRFNGNDIKRFTASQDEAVRYFLRINPDYNQQTGVLVIVPVTIRNMAYTAARYLTRKLRKRFLHYRFPLLQQEPANA